MRNFWQFTGSLIIGSSFVFAASTLSAREVEATKKAPIQTFFPNAYGEFELRNYQETDQKTGRNIPKMQARYTLGSTFFDGRLDTKVTFAANKYQETDTLESRGTRVEMQYYLFSGEFFSVTPFAEIYLPHKEHGTQAKVGFETELAYEAQTSAGALTPSVNLTSLAYLHSRPTSVYFNDQGERLDKEQLSDLEERLNLAGNNETLHTFDQKAPNLKQQVKMGVNFDPSMVSGLSFAAKQYHVFSQTPKMKLSDDKTTADLERDNLNLADYKTQYERYYRLSARYDFSGDVYLANDLYITDRLDNHKMTNLVSLGITLF